MPPPARSLCTRILLNNGIERYNRVTLPTFREVLTQWNRQRREAGLVWGDMWIFKADITGCFNQIHWTTEVSKLMGFMLNLVIMMIMITCGGFGVTPQVLGPLRGKVVRSRCHASRPPPCNTLARDGGAGHAIVQFDLCAENWGRCPQPPLGH